MPLRKVRLVRHTHQIIPGPRVDGEESRTSAGAAPQWSPTLLRASLLVPLSAELLGLVSDRSYMAQNQEHYANSICRASTVEPMQVVTGDLIIKTCCDPYAKAGDVVRFEVTARGKTSVFEFVRAKLTQ